MHLLTLIIAVHKTNPPYPKGNGDERAIKMAAAACSYDPLEKASSSVLQCLNSLGISKLTKEQ